MILISAILFGDCIQSKGQQPFDSALNIYIDFGYLRSLFSLNPLKYAPCKEFRRRVCWKWNNLQKEKSTESSTGQVSDSKHSFLKKTIVVMVYNLLKVKDKNGVSCGWIKRGHFVSVQKS